MNVLAYAAIFGVPLAIAGVAELSLRLHRRNAPAVKPEGAAPAAFKVPPVDYEIVLLQHSPVRTGSITFPHQQG